MVDTDLLTVAEIADELGHPYSKVSYVIKKERISPVIRAALTRLFSRDQIGEISKGLQRLRTYSLSA